MGLAWTTHRVKGLSRHQLLFLTIIRGLLFWDPFENSINSTQNITEEVLVSLLTLRDFDETSVYLLKVSSFVKNFEKCLPENCSKTYKTLSGGDKIANYCRYNQTLWIQVLVIPWRSKKCHRWNGFRTGRWLVHPNFRVLTLITWISVSARFLTSPNVPSGWF